MKGASDGHRILIVEDDPALRALMLRALREDGYEGTGTGVGVEMGRSLEAGSLALVLLDAKPLPRGLADLEALPGALLGADWSSYASLSREALGRDEASLAVRLVTQQKSGTPVRRSPVRRDRASVGGSTLRNPIGPAHRVAPPATAL